MRIEDVIIRRLVYSKFFYNHGLLHSMQKTQTGNMLAIHHFDISIEIALKVIANKENIVLDRNEKFNSLWKKVEQKCEEIKKFNVNVFAIHDARNQVQHHANIPSNETIDNAKVHTKDFLETIIQYILRIPLYKLSLTLLIENMQIKELMEKAEAEIEHEDYVNSTANIKRAFDKAMVKYPVELPYEHQTRSGLLRMDGADPKVAQYISRATNYWFDAVSSLQQQLVILLYGINYQEYVRFLKCIPHIARYADGHDKVKGWSAFDSRISHNPSKEDSQFAFNFALDCILTWQENVR